MANAPDRSSLVSGPNASRTTQSGLSRVPLSLTTMLLASCGTIGGILFTATYLIEGITRPGYNAWQQPISSLSLGPGGWVQQVNFIVFGVLLLCAAFGWRQVLKPGVGAIWFPILEGVTGLGMIVDGIFSQDPVPGFPPGAVLTAPTLHGEIHLAFAFLTITTLALSCFVMARRFAVGPGWRGWTTYSVITGLLTIILIALFGAQGAYGGVAGLFERLATGIHSLWSLLLVVLLWLRTR